MIHKLLLAGAMMLTLSRPGVLHAGEPDRAAPQPLTADLRQRCMETLRTAIQSNEFWPGIHAAEALTLAGVGDDVIKAFGEKLPSEPDDQRRCGLAREMVRAGDHSRVAVLFAILADAKSSGRTHAAESLYKVGEVGDRKLLQAAAEQAENQPLKLYATAALAKSGDPAAMAQLHNHLQSDNRANRNTAAYALARIGSESDIKLLLSALERETDAGARGILVCALAALGNAQGRELLGRNLDSPDAGVRSMAAEFVGHSRSVEFHPRLVRLLDDATLDVRVRAAESLLALSLPAAKR